MAGIYIHIPFCKVKCHYCDFHFSVQLNNKPQMVEAICTEIGLRKNEVETETINTIYFGGGTPSVISANSISKILESINKNYSVSESCEMTFECNPDDLSTEHLLALKALGINRLSIGIQSFDDEVLKFMNRAHSAEEAKNAVKLAQDSGFDNLTIDLIYGVPGTDINTWQKELDQMTALQVPHLSAYCLTIEEGTVFGNWQKTGKLKPFADSESLKQFQYLMDFTATQGYEQYEISNFAKNGFISQHNSAYWKNEKYLGIGPSAHSFSGKTRSWNISNNNGYIKQVQTGKLNPGVEELSVNDQFNEYILTRLRTKWGITLADLNAISTQLTMAMLPALNQYVKSGHLTKTDELFLLTNQGKYISDGISADLFQ